MGALHFVPTCGLTQCKGLSYSMILDMAHELRSWGGAGGRSKDDYDEFVKVLMQKRQTQEDDEASLEEEKPHEA